MLHGLGFYTSLRLLTPHLISPFPRSEGTLQLFRDDLLLATAKTNFYFTPFDTHLVVGSTQTSLARQLQALGPIYSPPHRSFTDSLQRQPHHRVFQALSTIAMHDIYFNTTQGTPVLLETQQGGTELSLSHLSETFYAHTRESLMTQEAKMGTGTYAKTYPPSDGSPPPSPPASSPSWPPSATN